MYNILKDNNSLCLATPPYLPTHTYGYEYDAKTSTIDLMFCPNHYLPLVNTMTMVDLSSDHTPIIHTIEIYPEQEKIGKRPKWILKASKWDSWLQDVENYVVRKKTTLPQEI